LGPRDAHQSMVAAAHCPRCPSETADPEFEVDDKGILVRLVLQCRLCFHRTTVRGEPIGD
jgi:hypothetical protein